MTRRLKLSAKRQRLVVEYMPLADILAKYFVQNRQRWQRSVLIADLQSEGYLALVKAARTYDPKRLPYPKAYFARAVLNAMYKAIKKLARQPGEIRITLEEAADLLPEFDHVDHIRLAIADLPELDFTSTRRLAAAGGQHLGIGRKAKGIDPIHQRRGGVAGADDAFECPGWRKIPGDGAAIR